MELEKQVCSLELAQKLTDLDVDKEPYFCWYSLDERYTTLNHDTIGGTRWVVGQYIKGEYGNEWYPAYTVAELGVLLPEELNGTIPHQGRITEDSWWVQYRSPMTPKHAYPSTPYECDADTEANARAKMLVFLLENDLIEPNAN